MTARTSKTASARKTTFVRRPDVGVRLTNAEFRTWEAYQRLPETKKALCRRFTKAVAEAHAR